MVKQGIIGLAALLLAACSSSELERKLEGKWQLKEVEANGTTTTVDTVYYNFQNTLFLYQIANSNYYNGSSYGYKTDKNDSEVQLEIIDRSFLPHTDWSDTCRVFTVNFPSHSKLILKSDGKTYTFKRF